MFSWFFYDNFLAKLSPLPPKSFQSVSLELVPGLVVTDLAVLERAKNPAVSDVQSASGVLRQRLLVLFNGQTYVSAGNQWSRVRGRNCELIV